MTAVERLAAILRDRGEHCFMVDAETRKALSYRDVVRRACAVAHQLADACFEGPVVGVSLSDPLWYVPTLLGAWSRGLTAAVLDPNLTEGRLERLVRTCGVTHVLSDHDRLHRRLYQEIRVTSPGRAIESIDLDISSMDGRAPALLLFSSGTTGMPKCIPLSLDGINANVASFSRLLGMSTADVFLSASPLWHAHGLYNSLLTALLLGASVVYVGPLNVVNAAGALDVAIEHRATVFHVTPSMLPILTFVGRRKPNLLPPLRHVICGTARLAERDKQEFETLFNMPILQQYGMTEVLFISVNQSCPSTKPHSVGEAIGCEIQIRDDEGTEARPLTPGNIWVKSPSAFGSYFSQPEETRTAYRDGWFQTGDLGWVDNSGALTISGRKKDIIKKGGFHIAPDEIDAVLLQCGEVRESATVGVLDRFQGEEIYSFVVCGEQANEERMKEHCRRNLPRHHVPKQIIMLPALPKTETGKIKKMELAELARQHHLNLVSS